MFIIQLREYRHNFRVIIFILSLITIAIHPVLYYNLIVKYFTNRSLLGGISDESSCCK